jgi:hypothetical protein
MKSTKDLPLGLVLKVTTKLLTANMPFSTSTEIANFYFNLSVNDSELLKDNIYDLKLLIYTDERSIVQCAMGAITSNVLFIFY